MAYQLRATTDRRYQGKNILLGIQELNDMGRTPKYFVRNYKPQLSRLKVSIDLGEYSFTPRECAEGEDPLIPIAEVWMEMSLHTPYKNEKCGIPVTYPSRFLVNAYEHYAEHSNDRNFLQVKLAENDESKFLFYLNESSSFLGTINALDPNKIDILSKRCPMALAFTNLDIITRENWINALNANISVAEFIPVKYLDRDIVLTQCMFSKKALSCFSQNKDFDVQAVGITHEDFIDIALIQDFDITKFSGKFSESEIVEIISSNLGAIHETKSSDFSGPMAGAVLKVDANYLRNRHFFVDMPVEAIKYLMDLNAIQTEDISSKRANEFPEPYRSRIQQEGRSVQWDDANPPF